MLKPIDVAKAFSEVVMPKKADYKKTKTFALALAAGAFIAFGAVFSMSVTAGIEAFGLAKLISGIAFATGLILVVLTGAELFTGNVIMTLSVLEKKVSIAKLLRNWLIVYFGNLAGALIVVFLVYYSGLWRNCNFEVGAIAISSANAKVHLSFVAALFRGILCNWLVCLAVWLAASAKDVAGKILAIVFPITAFVASGFEHSVANMFYIPYGIMLKTAPGIMYGANLNPEVFVGLNLKGFLWNIVPVTLGNIIGAFLFVVLLFWIAYIQDEKRNGQEGAAGGRTGRQNSKTVEPAGTRADKKGSAADIQTGKSNQIRGQKSGRNSLRANAQGQK